jgi:hypothetical protein
MLKREADCEIARTVKCREARWAEAPALVPEGERGDKQANRL